MTSFLKRIRVTALCSALVVCGGVITSGQYSLAFAASQRILVVVNDRPITDRDVVLRMKLNSALGASSGSTKKRRDETLKLLIDEIIAKTEAKKLRLTLNPKHVEATLNDMAKGAGTTVKGLTATLGKKGISLSTLRARVESTLTLRMVVAKKLKTKIEVTDAEVDKRHSKITSDPRLRPLNVYQIREVDLAVERQASEALTSQLLYARAIEAQQIAAKYKGCSSLRKAASGIFNVKISKVVPAPVNKLSKEMRKVLEQAGTSRLIGPMRGPKGIRMIAFCGRSVLKPPKPPRQVVKNMILSEKYQRVTGRVMRNLRRKAFIEYKDESAIVTQ